MKSLAKTFSLALLLTLWLSAVGSHAVEAESKDKDAKAVKPKSYPLKTCLVSDEKFEANSEMKPYLFVHEGQEIKLCCKSCLKDFKKDTAKYTKKLKELAAKEAAKSPK